MCLIILCAKEKWLLIHNERCSILFPLSVLDCIQLCQDPRPCYHISLQQIVFSVLELLVAVLEVYGLHNSMVHRLQTTLRAMHQIPLRIQDQTQCCKETDIVSILPSIVATVSVKEKHVSLYNNVKLYSVLPKKNGLSVVQCLLPCMVGII